jgi:hypothetical protein
MATLKQEGQCWFLMKKIPTYQVSAPVLAVGKVVPTNTAGREPTQDPMTGFACEDTPLGRGHILALFLGGRDIPENYAPQYEQWQQSGAWKRMEANVLEMAKAREAGALYMVVKLTYGRTGNIYAQEQVRFKQGEIFDWSDARIPSRFEVWTFRDNADGAQAFLTELNGTGDRPRAAMKDLYDLTAQPLLRPAFLTVLRSFDVSAMPTEDYDFWLRNLIRRWSQEAAEHAEDKAKKKIDEEVDKEVSKRSQIAQRGHRRLPSKDKTAIEVEVLKKVGFNWNRPTQLSHAYWKQHNANKIVKYIRKRLATSNWGIGLGDLTTLGGEGAEGFVSERLN